MRPHLRRGLEPRSPEPAGGGCSPRRGPRVGKRRRPERAPRGASLLTLHVFRHLPLFSMRSSQSQGFRLHFGQHDKTAAGGNGGSVSVREPSTWTRAAQIQLRREEGRGDPGARSPTRCVRAPSPELSARTSAPVLPPPREDEELGAAKRSADGEVRAPRRGSARAQPPHDRRAPGGQRRRQRGCFCYGGWAAAAAPGRLSPPPPALRLGIGRVSPALTALRAPSSPLSPPLPRAPSAPACSPARVWSCEVPTSLPCLAYSSRASKRSPLQPRG